MESPLCTLEKESYSVFFVTATLVLHQALVAASRGCPVAALKSKAAYQKLSPSLPFLGKLGEPTAPPESEKEALGIALLREPTRDGFLHLPDQGLQRRGIAQQRVLDR